MIDGMIIPTIFAAALFLLLAAHANRVKRQRHVVVALAFAGALHSLCYVTMLYPVPISVLLYLVLAIYANIAVYSVFFETFHEGRRRLPVYHWVVGPALVILAYILRIPHFWSNMQNFIGFTYAAAMVWLMIRHRHFLRENMPSVAAPWLAGLFVWIMSVNLVDVIGMATWFVGFDQQTMKVLVFGFGLAAALISIWLIWQALANVNMLPALSQESVKRSDASPEDVRMVNSCCALMENENIYQEHDLTVAALADRLAVTPRELSEAVNRVTGNSVPALIRRYRINHAKALLTETGTEQSVLDVALESGFGSKSSFNEAFKRETGLTPSDFRDSNSHALYAAE